ncbi:MAG: hypothetical protein WA061_02620 [Microgenomates group bacterium]
MKKSLHYKLCDVIKKRGTEVEKKHGSYWVLKLQSKTVFVLDDYSWSLSARYPDKTRFWFGSTWGTDYEREFKYVSELHLLSTIELLEIEKIIELSYEDAKKYVYG